MRKIPNAELGRPSPQEAARATKLPYCIVLDDVRSMLNVGSVFRTADAFGATQIVLGGITAAPPHREIQKTALGATETVAWVHTPALLEYLHEMQKQGWLIVAVEQAEPRVLLHEFAPQTARRYAFVFGNEVEGVGEQIVQMADLRLEIPQFGAKHSLNIAVSAGVVAWDFVQKILPQHSGTETVYPS